MYAMKSGFYRAVEERHRGSRQLVKERLKVYLPFVLTWLSTRRDLNVADLGCGRGEWLELLREHNIKALGVDVDEDMLLDCRERDLAVETMDAAAWLAQQPDGSHDIVSAFHLAEHLPFACLDQLVFHSLRVLRPGGLLLLETPNPENIVVGSHLFYLDYTHQRPLPPSLLAFLPEYHGFLRTKILRLNETLLKAEGEAYTLMDVLSGASPDYAVIAQKKADEKVLVGWNPLFAQEYGWNMDMLAELYQRQQEERYRQQASQWREAMELARSALQRSELMHQRLQQVYASRSWRLTAPMRAFGELTRWGAQGARAWLTFAPQSRPYRIAQSLCTMLHRLVLRRPELQRRVVSAMQPFPKIRARLKQLVVAKPVTFVSDSVQEHDRADLSPRQRHFFNILKKENNTKNAFKRHQ
jgi:O-antigen chain-terminating methyltransferase